MKQVNYFPPGRPPYESGEIWTFNSHQPPAEGFRPSDVHIRNYRPMFMFCWSKATQ